jgi:2-oxoglutarate dehydrogenase E2 component (dihydrolipoamide succinyltransferase)
MPQELKVPELGESIEEVRISQWLKRPGERIEKDDDVVEIESEKATVTVAAQISGVLARIMKQAGESAHVGEVIGVLEEQPPSPAEPPPKEPDQIAPPATAAPELPPPTVAPPAPEPSPPAERRPLPEGRTEEAVPMSPLRLRIAGRLLEAQQNAALLTTFNEIDMGQVAELRRKYREAFAQQHGAKLGLVSFFVKAVVEALREFPVLNAEVRGETVVYRNYFDIGIAVGGGKGLVVPVLRNAERMGFSDIERAIADFAARAQANQLRPDELTGGTFTISNGGVYGSLLSTPIVNPPQSGILGLHAIQDRPVAREGQVVIRPMMYVALTYDHRIVDGRQAVTWLRRVKDLVEDPARLLLVT